MHRRSSVVALESRLKPCRNVITLGVQPNWMDYDPVAQRQILDAEKVYYPSIHYVGLLNSLEKKTFPSLGSYLCAQDKVRQTTLFDMAGVSHPRTRIFFGKRQASTILDHFSFPFVAKIARGSALGRGVFCIQNAADLSRYLSFNRVAYIQEYLPSDRDIRVVVIGSRIVHAYWRVNDPGNFRSNVFQGGRVKLGDVPEEATDLALRTAVACGWDDVGIDILAHEGRYYVLEGNMKYGRKGFSEAGMDYYELMDRLIENGDI